MEVHGAWLSEERRKQEADVELKVLKNDFHCIDASLVRLSALGFDACVVYDESEKNLKSIDLETVPSLRSLLRGARLVLRSRVNDARESVVASESNCNSWLTRLLRWVMREQTWKECENSLRYTRLKFARGVLKK